MGAPHTLSVSAGRRRRGAPGQAPPHFRRAFDNGPPEMLSEGGQRPCASCGRQARVPITWCTNPVTRLRSMTPRVNKGRHRWFWHRRSAPMNTPRAPWPCQVDRPLESQSVPPLYECDNLRGSNARHAYGWPRPVVWRPRLRARARSLRRRDALTVVPRPSS